MPLGCDYCCLVHPAEQFIVFHLILIISLLVDRCYFSPHVTHEAIETQEG